MERNLENPERGQDALESATQIARERQLRRERIVIGAWGGATLIALVAMCMLLEGCGSGSRSHTAQASRTQSQPEVATAVVASNPSAVPVADGVETSQLPGTLVEDPGMAPPDVVAAMSDTFVTAGQAIEVAVEGTSDVSEMALSDGRGDAIPMVKDESGSTWRVGYRVPLRPGTDRLGLAVTAKNQAHRWRRVWVFLQVDDGKQQVETGVPAADTTSQQ
jgi:hypothetical protein